MVALNLPDIDDRPLTFGKHKGSTPNEVAETDHRYVMWLYENIEPKVVSKDLYQACELDSADDDIEYLGGGVY